MCDIKNEVKGISLLNFLGANTSLVLTHHFCSVGLGLRAFVNPASTKVCDVTIPHKYL